MYKLKDLALAEIEKIENQGLTTSTFQTASELVDMVKDLCEIEAMKQDMGGYDDRYRGDNYHGNYNNNYNQYGGRGDHGRGDYGRDGYAQGRYRTYRDHDFGKDRHFEYMMEDIEDGVVTYHEGRGRMRYGNADTRTLDGLEKLMHGIASLVDATMEMAETQEEKDIIKKHLQKIKTM